MEPRILVSGDCAVSVLMGDEISLEVNQKVKSLMAELLKKPIKGVTEMVPTYAALMVHYKPEAIRFSALAKEINQRILSMEVLKTKESEVIEIPVCYGGAYGPDLEDCAKFENMTAEKFIEIHSGHEYYVYMMGFAPGHAYAARFDEPFHFKRRETARVKVPGQSIAAQLGQSNLIPFEQPCGWNIMGATPLKICDYSKEDPFLVHAGEWFKFVPISEREYQHIKKQAEQGTYKVRRYQKGVR